ncbi:FCD domain-containing protein [Vreelandella sp. GE22]
MAHLSVYGVPAWKAINTELTWLYRVMYQVSRQLYRVRYLSNQKNEKWATAMEEHEAILAALEARDGKRVGHELRNHLGKTWIKYANGEQVYSPPR